MNDLQIIGIGFIITILTIGFYTWKLEKHLIKIEKKLDKFVKNTKNGEKDEQNS